MRPRAPYRFIPLVTSPDPLTQLEDTIICPEWGELVSHDVPFSDGISGTLHLKITNHTPLFIRGTDAKHPDLPYKTPDKKYAIPGTSLRGMLRGLLEAISFGKIRYLDPVRGSIRDLTTAGKEVYQKHLTETTSHKTFRSKVKTGWLDVISSEQWRLYPCKHWRIETNKDQHQPGSFSALVGDAKFWRQKNAEPEVRLARLGQFAHQDIYFEGDDREKSYSHSEGKHLIYRKANKTQATLQDDMKCGRLVVTGKPSSKKHLEFIFESPSQCTGNGVEISSELQRDFISIHSEDPQKHKTTPQYSGGLKFWMEAAKNRGSMIPVFYIEKDQEDQEVSSLGMSQMMRLRYRYSPQDLYSSYRSENLTDPSALDFAELLFGLVGRDAQVDVEPSFDALRGRVQIETAQSSDAQLDKQVEAVLLTPKTSYFPFYLQQKPSRNTSKVEYKTWMDDNAQIAGFKRYPRRVNVRQPPHPTPDQVGVKTPFKPISRGTTFTTKIYIHNLRPEELGALLWVIDFDERPKYWHQLGMAKAFGYGSVSLEIVDSQVEDVYGQTPDLREARDCFIRYMERRLFNCWSNSPQLEAALTFASPMTDEEAIDFEHMELGEFKDVKKDGGVLPSLTASSSYEERNAIFKQYREEEERSRLGSIGPLNILAEILEDLDTEGLYRLMQKMGPLVSENCCRLIDLSRLFFQVLRVSEAQKEHLRDHDELDVVNWLRNFVCQHPDFDQLRKGTAKIQAGARKQKEAAKPFK